MPNSTGPKEHAPLVRRAGLLQVLIQFQLPMTDFRAFALDQRLPLPTWPTPEVPKQFVRSFGGVKKRERGGLSGWPGEDPYCDASRAICVPSEVRRDSSGRYWQPISMRLYSDASPMTKLELGFRARPSSRDLSSLVSDLLNIRVRVGGRHGAHKLVRLSECGNAISSLYEFNTTRSECYSVKGTRRVFSEAPSVFVAVKIGKADPRSLSSMRKSYGIPFGSMAIDSPGSFKETRVFKWNLKSSIGNISTFVMIANEGPRFSPTSTLNRQLRLYILRLNAEYSTLRRVLQSMAAEQLNPKVHSDDSRLREEYLDRTIKRIARSQAQLENLAEGERKVADAAMEVFERFFPGDIKSLSDQIERLSPRPMVRRELILPPASNTVPKELTTAVTEEKLLLPEQAIPLLRTQLEEEVEDHRHDDPDVYGWELLTLNIVKRTFGQHSSNANQFACTVSYAGQSDEKAQAWHIDNIKSKKGILRAFIKELEILSPHRPQADDARFAKMAIDEARKSTAEDERVHPMVGCVVVKDGKVLATAHRGEMEGRHAEFIALEEKLGDEALTGCTVYTTLEPCTTRNHPKIPCADRLIERMVARVVIGTLDPNPDIRGRGVWKLQDAGIAIEMFPHAQAMELKELNRNFFRSIVEPTMRLQPARADGLVPDSSTEPNAESTCDFSPRALILSKELSIKAFPLISESNWSEEIELSIPADSSEIDSVFSRFRGHKEVLVVAYGFDVAVAKLKSVNRVASSGRAHWKLQFDPIRSDFANDMEVGTSGTTADEFAEKRVRRLLLNENPMAFKSDKDDMLGLANEAMFENLIQGLNSIVKIEHSTFIDLHSDFSADPIKFVEIAWISAVADLKLSAAVQHIYHLRLDLERDVLKVDFSGRRQRKYMNVPPYEIKVKGAMSLASGV